MQKIIIRKTQYSIRLMLSSLLLLSLTTGLSKAQSAAPLELSLAVVTSQPINNDFYENTNSYANDQLSSLKPFQVLQPLHSLQSTKLQSAKNLLSRFQERYLTYHYGKNERIKAVYEQGAYCITYQQEW